MVRSTFGHSKLLVVIALVITFYFLPSILKAKSHEELETIIQLVMSTCDPLPLNLTATGVKYDCTGKGYKIFEHEFDTFVVDFSYFEQTQP